MRPMKGRNRKFQIFRLVGGKLAALLLAAWGLGCTHTYALRLEGKTAPNAQVKASHWVQARDREAPRQQEGPPVTADEQGDFSVLSATVLDFAGPPPHVVLEVRGAEALPLCAVVPTVGLWNADEAQRTIALPPLRPLAAGEVSYELTVPGLPGPVKVMRLDPDKERCVATD